MKLGWIGIGNMGSALMQGILRAHYMQPEAIWIYDVNEQRVAETAEAYGVHGVNDLKRLIEAVDMVVMAVKPHIVPSVLEEGKDALRGKALLNVAVTWNYARYREYLDEETRVIYAMVNTPCAICEGATLLEDRHNLTDEEYAFVKGMFEAVGTCGVVNTSLAGIAGSLNGCTPAFTQMFIEALADAAVYYGMSYDAAIQLAAQAVAGAAKTTVETGLHPAKLKNNVCSPGGTTIRGVRALEEGRLRATVMEALAATLHDRK